MDLVVFENNKPWVIDGFREGRFDYVELASDIAEPSSFSSSSASRSWTGWYNTTRRRETAIMCRCGCTSAANSRYGCTASNFHSYPLIVRAHSLLPFLFSPPLPSLSLLSPLSLPPSLSSSSPPSPLYSPPLSPCPSPREIWDRSGNQRRF